MIVVHIGLRKAGSASLQAFLAANAGALAAQKFDYPAIGRVGPKARTAHANLAHDLRGVPRFDPAFGSLADLAAHRRASPPADLILSSEMFEDGSRAEAARLGSLLRRADDEEVRIVLIVRDLASVMASSYGQKVKYGAKTHDFDRFFARRIDMDRVDYFATAERWAEAFGWGAMRVRRLGAADLIDDFAAVAGFDPAGLIRPGEVNVTPGWRVLEAVRALARGRHGLPADHRLAGFRDLSAGQRRAVAETATLVGAEHGWNADRGRYLTAAQLEACGTIYRRAMERLAGKTSLSPLDEAPAPAPRDFLPDASHIENLRAFYDAVAERLAPLVE